MNMMKKLGSCVLTSNGLFEKCFSSCLCAQIMVILFMFPFRSHAPNLLVRLSCNTEYAVFLQSGYITSASPLFTRPVILSEEEIRLI